MPEHNEIIRIGTKMIEYCGKFDVPIEYLFEILEDQKVTPMIRGKAMEYNAFLLLDKILPKNVWSVQKLNLNAQTGAPDEDISVTHRRSGVILKVESKSAVRGSMRTGKRAKILRCPHFKVKCHRSRSKIELATTSNDRYSVDSFDIILTTPLNAIFAGNTIGEILEVINKPEIEDMLYQHYQADNNDDLIRACSNDWRYCIPEDIAEDGFIPRTPYVKLTDDPNWRPISEIETRLIKVVQLRRTSPSRRR
jgi:hypothetical protein